MRVLVFEIGFGGHRTTYLRHLLEALARLDCEVILYTSREAWDSSESRINLDPVCDRVQVEASSERTTMDPLGVAREKCRWLEEAGRRFRPDHVFVPTGDGMSEIMAPRRLLRGGRWWRDVEVEVIMHGCRFAYPQSHWRRRQVDRYSRFALRSAGWARVHFVDVLAYDFVRKQGGVLAERSRLLPDPIEPVEQISTIDARRMLDLPEDGRCIGCIGEMSARKGIDLLIRAFVDAERRPTDRLLLIGRHDEQIVKMLEAHRELLAAKQIVSVDRFLEMEKMACGFASMDLVATPYRRTTAISSIALRAVAAGRPVLGTDQGWLGALVPKLGLGWTCDVLDPEVFRRDLSRCLDRAEQYRPTEAADRLLAFHAPENFIGAWTARLRERMGLAPYEDLMDWSHVLAATDKGDA